MAAAAIQLRCRCSEKCCLILSATLALILSKLLIVRARVKMLVQAQLKSWLGELPDPNRICGSSLAHHWLLLVLAVFPRVSFRFGLVARQTYIVVENRHLQQRQSCSEGCFPTAALFQTLSHALQFLCSVVDARRTDRRETKA